MLYSNFFNTYYFFKFPPIFSWIKILWNNRNRGCQFQHNRGFQKYCKLSKNRNRDFLKTVNRSITTTGRQQTHCRPNKQCPAALATRRAIWSPWHQSMSPSQPSLARNIRGRHTSYIWRHIYTVCVSIYTLYIYIYYWYIYIIHYIIGSLQGQL